MDEKIVRLYEVAEKFKGTKGRSNLTRFLNTSPQTLNNWESRGVSSKGLIEAARATGALVEWPETGTGFMDGPHTPELNVTVIGTVGAWDSRVLLSGDDCGVLFCKDIHLVAGNGLSDDIEDYDGYKPRFSKITLRRHGISPAAVICVCASGDSMGPALPDGVTLGINTADKTAKDGKIHAANHGRLLRTKIFQKLLGNKIRIRSYNAEAYPDKETDVADINITGHVF